MSRIVRNTTAVSAAFVTNTILSFLQIKLLTHWLPQTELGEYFATVALGALISVLAQIGLPMVVLRFTAKYDALNDLRRIVRLVWFAWSLVLVLSVALLVVEWWALPGLLRRIYDQPPAPLNVLLATSVFAVMALRQMTYACFDGLRRMSYPALFENCNIAVITFCIVIMRQQLTLSFLLQLSLVSGAVFFLLSSATLLHRLHGARRARTAATEPAGSDQGGPAGERSGSEPPPLLPDILPFWSGAALNGLVSISLGYADKLLVSLFLPFQVVSVFYVAERLTLLMKRLLGLPLHVASPEITRRWELGRREELRSDLGFLLKAQLAMAVLVAVVTFTLAEFGVQVVSSSDYLQAANLLRLLAVSVVMMALYAPITIFLRAIERIHLALISDVLWIVLYMVGGALLVPRLQLFGIVLAQVMASTITAIFNLIVGQRVARVIWDLGGVLRIAILGVTMAAGGLLLVRQYAPFAWWLAPGLGVLVALIYHLLLIGIGALTRRDRRRLRALTGGGRIARLIDAVLFWPMRGRGDADTEGEAG